MDTNNMITFFPVLPIMTGHNHPRQNTTWFNLTESDNETILSRVLQLHCGPYIQDFLESIHLVTNATVQKKKSCTIARVTKGSCSNDVPYEQECYFYVDAIPL